MTLEWVMVLVLVLTRAAQLTPAQRNGGDTGYGLAFALFAALTVCWLASWIAAAAAVARRAELTLTVLSFQALAGAIVAVAMGVVTGATAGARRALRATAPAAD